MSATVYDDFPACLARYAWLVEEAATTPARLFNEPSPHYCKACGDAVAPADWRQHVREHRRQLQQLARRRQREATSRLRQVNRLRAEARA